MDEAHSTNSGPPGAAPGGRDERSGGADESLEDAFERIEAALDEGRSDLGRLGFWRVLPRIKADPALADRWADRAGRIDATAFERRVPWRFPIWLGNAALVAGVTLGAAGIVAALRSDDELVAGAGLILAAGAWSVSVHGLAHWAVGRATGIRFTSYFFRPGQFPPRPGIKTDYATYLRAEPSSRAAMHAAGAIATKLAPFVALAFAPASGAPGWAVWIVIAIGAGQIATDVLFSTKSGDWSKVARERAFGVRRVAG